jgi:hypothetical protein
LVAEAEEELSSPVTLPGSFSWVRSLSAFAVALRSDPFAFVSKSSFMNYLREVSKNVSARPLRGSEHSPE